MIETEFKFKAKLTGKHLKKILEIILKGAGLLAILKELIIILPI